MNKIPFKLALPIGSMLEPVRRLLESLTGLNLANLQNLVGYEFGLGVISVVELFKSQELPIFLDRGIFDLGIVGQDWLWEREVAVVELRRFMLSRQSFNPVQLVLAAPKSRGYLDLRQFPGGSIIATEYPNIAKKFLGGRGREDIEILFSYGQTERKPAQGIADAVIDITETGRSLRENGLDILDYIADSWMTVSASRAMMSNSITAMAAKEFADQVREAYCQMAGYSEVITS